MGFNLPPIKIVLGVGTFDLSQLIKLKQGCLKSITVQVTFIGKDKRVFVIPTGTTAKVRMLKPDQKKVLDDTEHDGTVEGNVIKFEITDQMQAYPGRGALEIILFNGGETVTSSTCGIEIIENVHNDSGIESTDEWLTVLNTLAVLEEKIQDANEAIDNANDAAQELINETLLIYKPNVANYAAIATTYPAPEIGWTTVANDTKIRWRYNGIAWVNSGTITTDPIATETTPGNVQGNGNVSVKTDGAMWADQYKDKGSITGSSAQFVNADDALIAITAMGGTGSVDVVAMNNNVINPNRTPVTQSGITATMQEDKSYILNGTANATNGVFILGNTYSGSVVFTLRKGTYVLRGTGTSLLGIYLYKADGTTINTSINNLTFTLSADTDFSSVSLRWFTASTVLNNLRVYPQVSFGSTLTAYEPYKENTLTIPDVTTATYPVYLTSYKGITNVFTLNTGQPTFTAIAKSELWARDYLQDLHIADIKDSNVTFTDAVADGTITSGSKISTIIGLIKYKLSALATAVAGKIDKTSISTTDTENSTTKVAAAAVTYALGQEIDLLNTKTTETFTFNGAAFTVTKYGNTCEINSTGQFTTAVPQGWTTAVKTLATVSLRPTAAKYTKMLTIDGYQLAFRIATNGVIDIHAVSALAINTYVQASCFYGL